MLVNVGDVQIDAGPGGSKVTCKAHFTVKPWTGGEEPVLEGPLFEGVPPYPWNREKKAG